MVHEGHPHSQPHHCLVRAFPASRGPSNFLLYTKQMVYSCPDGNQYCRKFGSRREVVDGVSYCTTGKLTADRLEERDGKIISRKRSELGKVRYASKNPFKGKMKTQKPPKARAKPQDTLGSSAAEECLQVEDEKDVTPSPEPAPVSRPPAPRGRRKARRGRRVRRKRPVAN